METAENLKNDIIKLREQELELIRCLNLLNRQTILLMQYIDSIISAIDIFSFSMKDFFLYLLFGFSLFCFLIFPHSDKSICDHNVSLNISTYCIG